MSDEQTVGRRPSLSSHDENAFDRLFERVLAGGVRRLGVGKRRLRARAPGAHVVLRRGCEDAVLWRGRVC